MQELELKFDLSAKDATRLLQSDLFGLSPTILEQRSIYFDTRDCKLHGHGLSLRIRQSGNRRTQTVKSNKNAAAGLFARQEWKQRVVDDIPVLDDRRMQNLLACTASMLAPVFEVHVKRHRWTVREADAVIEVALDLGKVLVADREAPICEIEFERKAGSTVSVFQLARKVDAITPLRLGVLSKADRGYRLIGPFSASTKAVPAALTCDMTAAQAFACIAMECLRQFRLNGDGVLWLRDKEALHQARVALRRLRSLFAIFKSGFNDSRFDHLRKELKWLASALGDARNIDVLMDYTSNHIILEALGKERDEAYTASVAALSSLRARSLMINMVEWIAVREWRADDAHTFLEQPICGIASGALDKLERRVRKVGRHLAEAEDENRHAVRIAAKRLRYAAEFFQPLYKGKTKRYRRFIQALANLQDELGLLNDLAIMPAIVERLGLSVLEGIKELTEFRSDKSHVQQAAKAHRILVKTKRFWLSKERCDNQSANSF